MSIQADKELILQAQNGDETAFEALIERHYNFIYRVVLKFCGVVEDAEDITQLVCMKLAEGIAKFNFSSSFTTWLYRVAINASKDYGRKKQRISFRERPIFDGFDPPDDAAQDTKNETILEVFALVSALPDKLKQATLLVYAENLTHKEVANILECSEGTVSWRISEAKKKLKDLAKQQGVLLASILMLWGILLCL